MSNIKIIDLPSGIAVPSGVVPCDNPTGTVTEKITLAQIRDLPHTHTDQQIKTSYDQYAPIEDPTPVYDIGTAKIVQLFATDEYTVGGLQSQAVIEDNTYTEMRLLSNIGDFDITFAHLAAPATQQIRCVNNANYVLPKGGSVTIYYDHIEECWRMG